MQAYVKYKPRTKAKTLQALKKTKLFSDMRQLDKYTFYVQVVEQKQGTKAGQKRLETALSKIPTVDTFTTYLDKLGTEKIIHLFFDIDSTLTHPGVAEINRDVKGMFEKFREQDCSVYFCTGRADHEVRGLMDICRTEKYGIAENGGIIINSTLPACKFGDRTEPDKLIRHMKEQKIDHCFDQGQKSRKTEHVIDKGSITRNKLNRAVTNSGACVEIHESKNTYHISKAGVNKGTAIDYLTGPKELSLDKATHLVVAVGDSGLDIPMFKHADRSYAVGNANSAVKKKATVCLDKNAPEAVNEIYHDLFKAG